MASSAKHLSTHLYFHMERNHRKQGSRNSQAGTSGFHPQSDLQHSPTSHRPRSWNKENDRIDMEQSALGYSGEIVSSYETPMGDSSPRHLSEHRGSIMGTDYPEDYFSYSPYLLTPDLSSKSRTRRRNTRRYGGSSSRYELCDDDDDYIQPIMEHPRLRPPEPASPILDRRVLPPTPNGSRDKEGPEDLSWTSLYQEDYEQDCFIVPSHMKGRFLPVKNVRILHNGKSILNLLISFLYGMFSFGYTLFITLFYVFSI